jgi:competence protein ComEC
VELFYGDKVVLKGKLELPEEFETDTGRLFDYPNYLRAKGVSAILSWSEVEYREEGGASLKKYLFALKRAFSGSLERVLPEPSASLMEGVLIGERRGLPEDVEQAFILSGLIHIVVLSGYNISIVAESILRAFTLFLPQRLALGAGAVGILFFAIMTGAGATTVRATAMGLIAILARYLNRPAAALRALSIAGALMVLWNPPIFFHDPSFILSILATFGLITLSPKVETYLTWVPGRLGLRSIAASTVAVQLFVLPALLYMTGVLSLFALPANILALPAVAYAMLAGFLAGIVGLLNPLLALPFAVLGDVLLRWIMFVAQVASGLPLSGFVVPAFPLWIAAAVYIPLTIFALRMYSASQSRSN